ncbi:hypothetical protein C8Q77DRAFT_457742 [Trametes polyzona]|nr:hypothetical protein C8Q77DRAFT_457742 [Trametes polyzona]
MRCMHAPPLSLRTLLIPPVWHVHACVFKHYLQDRFSEVPRRLSASLLDIPGGYMRRGPGLTLRRNAAAPFLVRPDNGGDVLATMSRKLSPCPVSNPKAQRAPMMAWRPPARPGTLKATAYSSLMEREACIRRSVQYAIRRETSTRESKAAESTLSREPSVRPGTLPLTRSRASRRARRRVSRLLDGDELAPHGYGGRGEASDGVCAIADGSDGRPFRGRDARGEIYAATQAWSGRRAGGRVGRRDVGLACGRVVLAAIRLQSISTSHSERGSSNPRRTIV